MFGRIESRNDDKMKTLLRASKEEKLYMISQVMKRHGRKNKNTNT